MGWDQVSGVVSVPCWHATPVANALWKPCNLVKGQVRQYRHGLVRSGGTCIWLSIRMSFNIPERRTLLFDKSVSSITISNVP